MLLIGSVGGSFSFGGMGWGPAAAWVIWYLVAFAPAILLGVAYHRTARDVSFIRAMVLSHLLLFYTTSGTPRCGGRCAIVFRRGGWTKTARLAEAPTTAVPVEASNPILTVSPGPTLASSPVQS